MTLDPLSVSCHLICISSPDINPIEEANFANVKHYLRQNDVILHSVKDSSSLIWNALEQISRDDCLGI